MSGIALGQHQPADQRRQAAGRAAADLRHGQLRQRLGMPLRSVDARAERRRHRRGGHRDHRHAHALQQRLLHGRLGRPAARRRPPRRRRRTPPARCACTRNYYVGEPDAAADLGRVEQPDGRPGHRHVDRRAADTDGDGPGCAGARRRHAGRDRAVGRRARAGPAGLRPRRRRRAGARHHRRPGPRHAGGAPRSRPAPCS